MPRTLVVPGVSVEARFDVPPPLPARSGILGAVGIVDRIPQNAAIRAVSTTQELFEIYGPATRFSFPEAVSALVNGVSQVIVSPVSAAGGTAATLMLTDDENQNVVQLRARAPGPWGNELSVRVIRTLASDRRTVRRVSLEVLNDGVTVERHDNMVMRAGDDNDLFTVINRDSGVIVAVDPVFTTDLPATDNARVGLQDGVAAAATGTLTNGGADLLTVTAVQPGEGGNRLSLDVQDGRASLTLQDPNNDPSVRIRAAAAGAAGAAITIGVVDDGAGGVNVTVTEPGNPPVRSYNGLDSQAALTAALAEDDAIIVERIGDLLPAPVVATPLATTRTLILREEGVRTVEFADMVSAQAMVDALNEDDGVSAALDGNAADLPDADPVNRFYLSGGRDAGWLRNYAGQNNPTRSVLRLVPADPGIAGTVRFQVSDGTEPNTVRLTAGVQPQGGNYVEREVFDNLSMDPDSATYLPALLEVESALLRALDLYPRQQAVNFPVATFSPRAMQNGSMPPMARWQSAIDALGNEDDVDLLLAGLQGWADNNLDQLAVQQAMLGHARAQTLDAKPRIALGSVDPDANVDIDAIIDHSGQVAGQRFVLVTPSGAEGAMAGLLGHLTYFFSPTFKTVAQPGVDLQRYSNGELEKLVGPNGNVCVITQKKGRGTICVKGIATDGSQISVTRVADRCIREVNAIANRFIGELNNAEQRNALKQMIVATFTQMERDGALVPSVDGSSPAFQVDVYASQTDVGQGNVRVDIAVRPVRAIDYVYATIRVRF